MNILNWGNTDFNHTSNGSFSLPSNLNSMPQNLHRPFQINNLSTQTPDAMPAISFLDHDTLIKYQNPAYITLLNRIQHAESQSEQQRSTISTLMNTINSLQAVITSLSSSAARPASQTPAPETTSSSSSSSLPSLPIPAPLEKDEYPDVTFWEESDWNQHKSRNHKPSTFGYLMDADGNTTTDARLSEMSAAARGLFIQLYYARKDPDTWSKRSDEVQRYFDSNMKTNFPEFCYCSGNWKLRLFGTIKFAEWSKNNRNVVNTSLKRERPSFDLASNRPTKHSKIDKVKKRKHKRQLSDTENAFVDSITDSFLPKTSTSTCSPDAAEPASSSFNNDAFNNSTGLGSQDDNIIPDSSSVISGSSAAAGASSHPSSPSSIVAAASSLAPGASSIIAAASSIDHDASSLATGASSIVTTASSLATGALSIDTTASSIDRNVSSLATGASSAPASSAPASSIARNALPIVTAASSLAALASVASSTYCTSL
ncbi:hypothetical protein EV360DRAFT_90042 [Lentinula raphanica]|nr:hypothetical protein EV360DRAFT_90042 [Lentinula raphanica]